MMITMMIWRKNVKSGIKRVGKSPCKNRSSMISDRAEGFLMSFQPLVYITPTCQGISSADNTSVCFSHNYVDLTEQVILVNNTQFSIYLFPVADCHCPLFCGFKGR